MNYRRWAFIILVVLAGCAGETAAEPNPTPAPTTAPTVAPEPTPEPTAIPEPTVAAPTIIEPLTETEALQRIRERSVNPATKSLADDELRARVIKSVCPTFDDFLVSNAGDDAETLQVKLRALMRGIAASDSVENQSAIQDLAGEHFCAGAYSDILTLAEIDSYSDLF